MNKLPILEHTRNETGRLIIHYVHKTGVIYHMFKNVITEGGISKRDNKFLYSTLNFEALHMEMLRHGFVPIAKSPDDQDSLVISYL